MADCTPAALHAHADAIDHAARLGGAVLPDGTRLTLDQQQREQWAADAALFRAAAHADETDPQETP
jgi:hypothetical protein